MGPIFATTRRPTPPSEITTQAGPKSATKQAQTGASSGDHTHRGLAEYLQVCERDGTDPLTASRAQVAGFVRELASRPGVRGANVVSIDSDAGLANATLQQRLVPVRLFYDYLVEEGPRESNPSVK